MVNVTVHHISNALDIEEYWTEERTPQLESVKIIVIDGPSFMLAEILPDDLRKAVETLQQIHSDMTMQKTVKHRLPQQEGKTCPV